MTFLQALKESHHKLSKKVYDAWKKLPERMGEIISLVYISSQTFTFALADTNSITVSNAGVNDGLKKVLSMFSFVFMWVGIVLLVAGIIQIISAVRNEDGERVQKNVAGALTGLLMAANRPIINAILAAVTGQSEMIGTFSF